jgi:hypothetical protein
MGLIYSPKIVTSGLIMYLDAADRNSYPGSGTTWYDLSGNSSNGTLVNGLLYSSLRGGAFTMDGGDETITFGSSILNTTLPSNSFTLISVVEATNLVYPRSAHPFAIQGNPTSGAKGWMAGEGISTPYIQIEASDGTNYTQGYAYTNASTNTIYHRVFTVDRASGVSTNYYVNGQLIGTVAGASTTGTVYTAGSSIQFGNNVGWRFIGNIYQFQMYNRALTASEIRQNYQQYKTRFNLS